jgi:hypothetical protein
MVYLKGVQSKDALAKVNAGTLAASNLTGDSLRTSGLTALHYWRHLKISILITWFVPRQPISFNTGQLRSERYGKKTADIHHLL